MTNGHKIYVIYKRGCCIVAAGGPYICGGTGWPGILVVGGPLGTVIGGPLGRDTGPLGIGPLP